MNESYEQLVEKAYKMHVSGNFNEAEKAYQNLLEINPNDLDVLNLYGQLNFSLKNYDTALEIFKKIYNETNLDEIKINILKVYVMKKDFENAIKTAESFNAKDETVLRLLSQSYLEVKNYKSALNSYLEIEALKKEKKIFDIDLIFNIGVLYRQLGDDENAIEYFNAVVNINPDYKLAYLNIARIYQNYDKNVSIDIYSQLTEKYPDDDMILSQLYIVYKSMLKHDKAYETALKLIEVKPTLSYPYTFAADSLYSSGKYEEAIFMYEKALKYSDDKEYCYIMIASMYSILNQGDKAVEIFETKLPEKTKENDTYAMIQLRERNIEKARFGMYKHLTNLQTEEELEKRAISYFYKLNLDKKYGLNEDEFKQFKTGKSQKNSEKIKYYLKKDLYGNNPKDKRVFLYSANGIGDMIMFSRYIHVLENYTKNIIIQSPSSMMRLMKYNFPQYKIISNDEIFDENNYDYSSSFFNLLFSLKDTSLKDIPYSSGYLSVDEEKIKEKEIKCNKKKVGLFWMGNAVIFPQRSVKLEELKSLFDLTNIQFYSFQMSNLDNESEKLKNKLPLIDLAPEIKDYMDTAGFLKNIDELVTIDTSIANLAGAMGVKTCLLLPYEAEWRWFHDRKKTPWYDSIKIFKQNIPYNWDNVIERVKNELTI